MRRLALVLGLCLAALPAFAQNNQGQLSQLPAKTGPLGGLVVECVSGCGSGGVGAAVDISSVGGVPLAPGGPISVNFTNTTLAVTGAFFQATQPVSGTFWQATQPVSGTFWQATQPVSGTFFQATQPVSGTFWQATQPVSGTLTVGVFPDNEPFNLAQVGGAATSLGQKTSANAIPVVLPNDALPPPDRTTFGDITTTVPTSLSMLAYGSGTTLATVTGTWTAPGGLVFAGYDGVNTLFLKGINVSTGALESTITGNGSWLLPTAGMVAVIVAGGPTASGTATVRLTAGIGSNTMSLAQPIPTGPNIIGGILSNVAQGTTAPTNVNVMGGKTSGQTTPQYLSLPLTAGGAAVQVANTPSGVMPLPLCNALRRTNCSPKGF